MFQLRISLYFKIAAIVLVGLLLFQTRAVYSLTRGETLALQLKKAIDEYKKNDFGNAVPRLERLAAFYENIISTGEDDKSKKGYGHTLLLLAACRERLLLLEMAKQTYLAAKKILGDDFAIPKFKLKKLRIYNDVKKMKAGAEAPAKLPALDNIAGNTDTRKTEK